ncbi:MAG: hypothetical protein RIC55_15355 [Pirellulaceae bacterium]
MRELTEQEMSRIEGGQANLLLLYLISPTLAVIALVFGLFGW